MTKPAAEVILAVASVPLILQAVALGFDEFVFHHRRGLPRWERLGHPLDTLTVLAALSVIVLMPLTSVVFFSFLAVAFVSCLFVTKDEWVHERHCDAKEQWLHSVLFVCHPLVFVSMAFLWSWRDTPHVFGLDATWIPFVTLSLQLQLAILVLFLSYQIIYWNIFRSRASDSIEKLKPPAKKSEFADPQSSVSETV